MHPLHGIVLQINAFLAIRKLSLSAEPTQRWLYLSRQPIEDLRLGIQWMIGLKWTLMQTCPQLRTCYQEGLADKEGNIHAAARTISRRLDAELFCSGILVAHNSHAGNLCSLATAAEPDRPDHASPH